MADARQLALLLDGSAAWNEWRVYNPSVRIDLRDAYLVGNKNLQGVNLSGALLGGADLLKADLSDANLSNADLHGASLDEARLMKANLRGADLSRAVLRNCALTEAILDECEAFGANFSGATLRSACLTEAVLHGAQFIGADLRCATLSRADIRRANLQDADCSESVCDSADLEGAQLNGTNFCNANLSEAVLVRATLVDTNMDGAVLTGSHIYGLSAWNIKGIPRNQDSLVVTPPNEPEILVDDLEVAQFIYLLVQHHKIRNIITTAAKKLVLLLGNFSTKRPLLDGIAGHLRVRGYLPVIFDFPTPKDRDLTETLRILASLSLFVVADLTEPRSVPYELAKIVQEHQIPIVPLIQSGHEPFVFFRDLQDKCPWVLELLEYSSDAKLLEVFDAKIVERALRKREELSSVRSPLKVISAEEE